MQNDMLTGFFQVVATLAIPKLDASSEARVIIQKKDPADGLTHRYYQSLGKHRYDILEGKRLVRTHLVHYDKKKIWVLHPRRQTYEELSFWPLAPVFENTIHVKESLHNVPVTHFTATQKNTPPLVMTLEWWLAADGFLEKAHVAIASRCDSVAGAYDKVWEFVNVERKPQARSLFEIPPGFQPASIGDKPRFNVGNMMKNTQIKSGRIAG